MFHKLPADKKRERFPDYEPVHSNKALLICFGIIGGTHKEHPELKWKIPKNLRGIVYF